VTFSSDTDPDFTDEFCGFLQHYVSNVDAAELLLLLARSPRSRWEARDIKAQLATTALTEADVQRSLDILQQGSIVARDPDRRFVYQPSPAHDAYIETLARLYDERPVTLFRVIYALRDARIKTFADAFRLRR